MFQKFPLWLPRFALPAILLGTLVVFGQVVSFDFVDWDDTSLILNNDLVKTFSPAIFWIFEPELYAPLSLFTFQIEHWLAGFEPRIFHFTNLVLHLINVMLTWKLLMILYRMRSANVAEDRDLPLPFAIILATALFALHPIQSEAVAWASARKELLWTTFALLALLAYVQRDESPVRTARAGGRITNHESRFLVLLRKNKLLLFTLLALMSKATAVMIPVILLLIDHTRGTLSKKAVKEKWSLFTIAVIFGLLGLLGKTGEGLTLTLWERVILMPAQIIAAFKLILWPFGYAVLHPAELPIELSSAAYVWPFLALAMIGVGLWLLRRRFPLVILGSAIFFLTLLPGLLSPLHANTVTTVTEHYLYFPMVGFAIALVSVLPERITPACRNADLHKITAALRRAGTNHKSRITIGALLLLVGLLSLRTFKQVSAWKDTISLFESAQQTYPRSAPILTNLGAAYARAKRYSAAESVLRQAVGLDPNLAQAHYNLGGLRYVRGDYAGAIAANKRVIELEPRHADAWRMLTWSYYRSGDLENARSAYDAAIRIQPAMRDRLPNLDGAEVAPDPNM